MYTRCLFCAGNLGRNEAVDAFPVGRRLAFDAAKGRLWVVCPGCARWNLTPLEERWEAVEQAERLFGRARLRASTGEVGLARVSGGVDLVRVGRPTVPELATWRYADVFARRRRRAVALRAATVTGAAVVTAGMMWGAVGAGMGLTTLLWWGKNFVEDDHDAERDAARAATHDEQLVTRVVLTRHPVSLNHGSIRRATLGHDGQALTLTFPFGRGMHTLNGDRAESAAGAMLTYLNGGGADREQVGRALDRLVDAGSASAFLAQAGRPPRTLRRGGGNTSAGLALGIASAPTRLALEIALSDERERRAMDGELAALERAWREAEEIAAMADSLGLPTRLEQAFTRLRGRARRATG